MAWQQNATLYGITDKLMQTLANTLQYTVYHSQFPSFLEMYQ